MKSIIVLSLVMFFYGCSENSTNSEKVVTTQKETKIVDTPKEEVDTKEIEIKEIVKSVKEEANTLEIEKEVIQTTRSGKDVYQACIACHGENAEKTALGKSKVIKGWDSNRVKEALNGYKDGSYGGAMKGLMKGQVSSLSNDEIESVSKYISKL